MARHFSLLPLTTIIVALIVPSLVSGADFALQTFIQGDLSYSQGRSQEPRAGFAADFQPAGGSMSTEDQANLGLGLRLGLEPSWGLESDWRVGLVAWQNVASWAFTSDTGEQDFFSTERIVSETSLDWWDDVTAVDLLLKTDTPALGVSVVKGNIKAVLALQHFELIRRDYAGEDVSGGRNDSHVKSETEIDDGFGQIIQLWYVSDMSNRSGWDCGVFYERYGSDAWFAGVSVRFDVNWFTD